MPETLTSAPTQIKVFLKDLEQEAAATRKMLARIPDDKYEYKPHPKSMNIRSLSIHIATLPEWIGMAINSDGLDFAANPYVAPSFNGTTELLEILEKSIATGRSALESADEDLLMKTWTLRNGETILGETPKSEVIRMSLNQVVHHRAQLGVYLRLLDIPIPGSYGPSADEH